MSTATLAAKRFFYKALKAAHNQEPRVINVDKNAAYPKAINELKEKAQLSKKVKLRQKKYLNNIIEFSALRDKMINQTWDGIWLVQHSSTDIKGDTKL